MARFVELRGVALLVTVLALLPSVAGCDNPPHVAVDKAKVTQENFEKLATSQSLSQVEAILGPGQLLRQCDIPKGFKRVVQTMDNEGGIISEKPSDAQYYCWAGDKLTIYIAVEGGKVVATRRDTR